MTQDEIIDMAGEAGIIHPEMVAKHLEAFAKLVAAKESNRIPLSKDTLQLIKELRPAIKPLEGMGKGKTTDEWFDILVKDIKEKNT
jgi:hypothetical protein